MPNQGWLPQDYTDRSSRALPFPAAMGLLSGDPPHRAAGSGGVPTGTVRNRDSGPSRPSAGGTLTRQGGCPPRVHGPAPQPRPRSSIPQSTIVPGRARGRGPLRREGPAKLTGTAKYADDLVFPGRLVRGDDPLDRRARPPARRSNSTRASTGRRSWSSPRPTSPATTSSARSSDDQPILVPVGGEIQHHAEPLALARRPGPGDAPRGARRRHAPDRAAPAGLRPARVATTSSPHYELGSGRPRRRRSRRPTSSSRASTGSATRSSSTSRTTR